MIQWASSTLDRRTTRGGRSRSGNSRPLECQQPARENARPNSLTALWTLTSSCVSSARPFASALEHCSSGRGSLYLPARPIGWTCCVPSPRRNSASILTSAQIFLRSRSGSSTETTGIDARCTRAYMQAPVGSSRTLITQPSRRCPSKPSGPRISTPCSKRVWPLDNRRSDTTTLRLSHPWSEIVLRC